MLNPIGQELQREFDRNEEICQHVIGLFQLIANKQRFRIICILSQGDFCVKEIAEILRTEKLSNLSQHLKTLRLSGIIRCAQKDNLRVYSLADGRVREMIDFFKLKYL